MEIRSELDKQFWLEMNHASDRTAAVASVAFLEDKLTDLIKVYLRSDKDTAHRLFKPTGPMGALQNKADLAYLLNLYKAETRDDIKTVADIRNKFAHWARPVTFGHKEIRQACEGIGFHSRLFKIKPGDPLHKAPPWPRAYAKYMFIFFVDMLSGHMISMTEDPKHPKVL